MTLYEIYYRFISIHVSRLESLVKYIICKFQIMQLVVFSNVWIKPYLFFLIVVSKTTHNYAAHIMSN